MGRFSLDFVSPADFEQIAAEISFSGQLLCRIDREGSDRELRITFFPDLRLENLSADMRFPLRDFLAIVSEVCADLKNIPLS